MFRSTIFEKGWWYLLSWLQSADERGQSEGSTLFFYKNALYKNKYAQNDPKFKNKLRPTPTSKYVKILEQWAWGLINIKNFRTASLKNVCRKKISVERQTNSTFTRNRDFSILN